MKTYIVARQDSAQLDVTYHVLHVTGNLKYATHMAKKESLTIKASDFIRVLDGNGQTIATCLDGKLVEN